MTRALELRDAAIPALSTTTSLRSIPITTLRLTVRTRDSSYLSQALRFSTVATAVCLLIGCGAPLAQPSGPAPTWNQFSLPNLPPGFRAAAYDHSRNSLWILNDQLGAQNGHSVVSLWRFDLATHSLVATPLAMNGDAFIRGSVLVDAQNDIWLGWGRTLVEFNPDASSTRSWALPGYSEALHQNLSVSDGNLVALGIDGAGEIWAATLNVKALFGFSPAIEKWDRTIVLSFLPNDTTRVAPLPGGRVAVNGAVATSPTSTPIRVLVHINTTSGAIRVLGPRAIDYVEFNNGRLLFVDDRFDAGVVNSSGDQLSAVATGLAVAHDPHLAAGASKAWFSMQAFRSIGVARLDLVTGAVARYAFPYIQNPGSPVPNDCPPTAVPCIPSGAGFYPPTQAIV